jgi:DNA replication protein DnaC
MKFSTIELKAYEAFKINPENAPQNICLIGNVGTGKTTVATSVARTTGSIIYSMYDLTRIAAENRINDLVTSEILILDDLLFSVTNSFGNKYDIAQLVLKSRFDKMEQYENYHIKCNEDLEALEANKENMNDFDYDYEKNILLTKIKNFSNARKKRTIITSNMSIDEIKESMGAPEFDRFKKFFKIGVRMSNGKSNR